MAQVHRLTVRLCLVAVDEHKLGKQALLHQAEGNGGANEAAANHGHLSWVLHVSHPFPQRPLPAEGAVPPNL